MFYQGLTLTNFETLDPSTAPQIIERCLNFLASTSHENTENHLGILLSIRILANLLAKNDSNAELLLQECQMLHLKFSHIFNLYAENGYDELCREMLWLLGNAYKTVSSQLREQYLQYDNFVDGLKVPKALLMG